MKKQQWRLAPAFDLVAPVSSSGYNVLALAYRYVPAPRRGPAQPPWLITRVTAGDLLAAASEHYGYDVAEAHDYLQFAAGCVAANWRRLLEEESIPATEVERFQATFSFARSLLESLA